MRLLLEAFDRGEELDACEAAEVAFLSERSALRYLSDLLAMRLIHIDRYERRGNRYIRIFAGGKARSANVPKGMTDAERKRKQRELSRRPTMSAIERALMPKGARDEVPKVR
jgi:hypothetical protein